MPVDALSGFPSCFTAGETVRVMRGWSNYPATGWSASLSLRSPLSNLTVAATTSGTNFVFVLTSTNTTALKPGVYRYAVMMTEAGPGDKVVVESGFMRVRPNMADTTVGPRRQAYETARTALESLAAKKFSSVSVEGQSWTLQSIDQLAALVRQLEGWAIEEDRELGLLPGGGVKRIQMRFG